MAERAPPRPGFLGALGLLLGALPKRRRGQLAGLTLLSVILAAAELSVVAAATLFVAALAGAPLPAPALRLVPGLAEASAATFAAGFAAAMLAANGLRLLLLVLGERFLATAIHELGMRVQHRLLAQPYAFHVQHRSSEAIVALDKTEAVGALVFQQWLQSANALATGLAVALFLALLDPLPALAAGSALALVYLVIARTSQARLQANSRRLVDALDGRIKLVQESLGAIRDVKLDHAEAAQAEAFRRIDERFAAARSSNAIIVAAPRFLVEIGAAVLLAALVAWLSASDGAGRALPVVTGIALGGLRLLPLLQSAFRNWASLMGSRALLDDVSRLLALPEWPEEEGDVAPLPFRRAMELRDVRLHYPGRAEPVLAGVSMTIRRGERVALAGETGAGKTSLADLAMGLLVPTGGTIAIDGVALDPANARSWQRNIAHVAQSIFLIDSTIAANIAFSRPGEEIDLDRVRAAADAAELGGFIASLPSGLDTEVGERGVQLSGGQRQRIGIARALYKAAPVLVLDEATNALDEATEGKVLANLWADPERTILLIAHRPSAIELCERVVRLAGGRVAEGG